MTLESALALMLLAASAAMGQTPTQTEPHASAADPLAEFREAVETKTADWNKLASGLEVKLARMLPCDARVRTTIEEVSHASEARLAATAQYLQAAATLAKGESERAQRALADQEAAGKDIDTERAETEQERAAIEGQNTELAESAKRRQGLGDAHQKLVDVAGMARQRAAHAEEQAFRREALRAALREVAAAYQSRQKALDAEVSSLVVEISRWGEYYIARVSRAQTECAITNSSAPPRKRR